MTPDSRATRFVQPAMLIAMVCALALTARLLVLWQVSSDPEMNHLTGDGAAYWQWASSIASGDWIGSQVFYQTPLYPYLIAIPLKLLHAPMLAIRIMQACAGALGCGVLALATRRLISPISGLIAGTMLALYPPAISYDLQIDKPVLDVALACWLVWCVALLQERMTWRRLIGTGAVCGLLSLNRENALILVPLLGLWLWVNSPGMHSRTMASGWWHGLLPLSRYSGRGQGEGLHTGCDSSNEHPSQKPSPQPSPGSPGEGVKRAGDRPLACWHGLISLTIFAVTAVVVLLPAAIRNTLIGREPILTTAQFGPNFYIGNNASADGIYHPLRLGRGDAMYERADATAIAEQDTGRTLTAGEVSHYWTRRTLHDIEDDPWRWCKLMVRKFVMTFANSELADSDVHDRFVAGSSILDSLDSVYGFGVLFTLAAVGIVLVNERKRLVILVMMIAALTATMSLFFVFARYRMVIVPMMIPLAAGALARLRPVIQSRSVRDIAMALFAACVAIGWVGLADQGFPFSLRVTNAYTRAKFIADRGRVIDAVLNYREAINQNPKLAAAYNNLGLLLADRGRLTEANPLLNEAIRLEPSDPSAQINYGMVLARQNDLAGAVEHFRCALQLDPFNTAARYNLAAALMMQGKNETAIEMLKPIAAADSADPFRRRAADLLRSISPATAPANSR